MIDIKSRRRVVCADGYSLSVQANLLTWSEPKSSGAAAYSRVEVGYIEDANHDPIPTPEGWEDYGDSESGIYAYVPSGLVKAFIEAHGGMVDGELPPLE